MDSLSQIALGSAVSVAVLGRHTAVWKAALWGAVAGTLPDLDVVIDHGDAVRNMVLHRAESHAPFWLTLFSLPFALVVARLAGDTALWKRWWLAMWLALVTHPLLDGMTVYGTQLGLPFTNHPYGVGSIFIIDPLYTVPLLVGGVWALVSRRSRRAAPAASRAEAPGIASRAGLRANAIGLALSTAYLAWSFLAQLHVERIARESLAAQGIPAQRVLVTPTAFNTVLWRVVAMSGDGYYHEGFYSLRDPEPRITVFDRFAQGAALEPALGGLESVRRIAAFSKGFYKLSQQGDRGLVTDLRMGQEPDYTFSFLVAHQASPWTPVAAPTVVGGRGDVRRGLAWLSRRVQGERVPPPR